jgi:hypothetical protein
MIIMAGLVEAAWQKNRLGVIHVVSNKQHLSFFSRVF